MLLLKNAYSLHQVHLLHLFFIVFFNKLLNLLLVLGSLAAHEFVGAHLLNQAPHLRLNHLDFGFEVTLLLL